MVKEKIEELEMAEYQLVYQVRALQIQDHHDRCTPRNSTLDPPLLQAPIV